MLAGKKTLVALHLPQQSLRIEGLFRSRGARRGDSREELLGGAADFVHGGDSHFRLGRGDVSAHRAVGVVVFLELVDELGQLLVALDGRRVGFDLFGCGLFQIAQREVEPAERGRQPECSGGPGEITIAGQIDGNANGDIRMRDAQLRRMKLDIVGETGGEPEVRLKHLVLALVGRAHDHVGRPRVRSGRRDGREGEGRLHTELLDDVDHVRQQRVPLKIGLGAVQMQEGLALDVARMRKDDSAAAHVDKPTVLVVHKRPLRSIVDERIGVEQCGGPAVKRTERQRYQLADGAGVYGRIHQIENQPLDALRPLGLWKRYEVPHVSPLLALYFAISLPAASTLRTGPSACPVIPDTPAFNGFDVVILPIVF